MSPTKIIIYVASAWFLYRLARSPRDPALRAVVACLVFRLISAPSTMAAVQARSGGILTPSIAKLILNLAVNASWFSLMLFFLFATAGSLRRAQREALLLGAVSGAMALAVFTTADRDHAFPTGGSLPAQIPASVAAFYVLAAGYGAYAILQAGRWALRYASESTRRTQWGLRLAALGLGLSGIAAALRCIAVVIRWGGGTVPAVMSSAVSTLAPVGIAVFVVGVCLAGLVAKIAALRVWARHRRTYHELRPLWELLNEAFPQDALDRKPRSRWHDRLSPHRMHRRYWRRVIEIRDGLVQLSPQLTDVGFDPEQPVHEQVDKLQNALRRQHDGTTPSASTAVLIAAPSQEGVEADVHQLVHLARAVAEQTSAPAEPNPA